MSARERVKVVEIMEATTGGTRRHLFDLVTHLDRDRFEVSVLCSTRRDASFCSDMARMRGLGVAVTEIPMRRTISPLHDLLALWRIWRYLRACRPAVVHTHSSKAGFLGRIAARLAGIGLVVHSPHVFAFQMEVPNMLRAFYFRLEQFAARLTEWIICVSPSEKDGAVACGLAAAEKCIVVRNGIEMPSIEDCERARIVKRAELGFAEGDVVVGSIGRFTKQKGCEYFLAAAKQLMGCVPEARFLLIGNGELRGEIDAFIRQSDMDKCFMVIDVPGDVSQYYNVFDIFVMTSLWEGMPYSLMEAMAAGRAVVAFGAGGIMDLISTGRNGMTVGLKDVDKLVSVAAELGRDPRKRSELGVAARETIRAGCSLEAMVNQVEQVYMWSQLT